MHDDTVLEPKPGTPGAAGRMGVAAAAARPAPATSGGRSPGKRHHEASDEYDAAHAEYLELAGKVTAATGDRNAAAGGALVGLIVLALSGTAAAWGVALIVVVGLGTFAARQQIVLSDVRGRCQTAIQKMYVAYRQAVRESGKPGDVPARPTETCS